MRIISGILKGRIIKVPKSGVRPTQDKVRGALFSILGESVCGARFLDLFAGSGAVGLEAWSRGAGFVSFVEADKKVLSVLRQNVDSLCDACAEVIGADAAEFLSKSAPGAYDIVFADPPYGGGRKSGEAGRKGGISWGEKLLNMIKAGDILKDGGLFILEDRAIVSGGSIECSGWELIDERKYGETRLVFFREL